MMLQEQENPYVVAAEKVDAAASLVSELTGVAQRFEEDAVVKGNIIADLVDSNKIFSGAAADARDQIDDLKVTLVERNCEIDGLQVAVERAEAKFCGAEDYNARIELEKMKVDARLNSARRNLISERYVSRMLEAALGNVSADKRALLGLALQRGEKIAELESLYDAVDKRAREQWLQIDALDVIRDVLSSNPDYRQRLLALNENFVAAGEKFVGTPEGLVKAVVQIFNGVSADAAFLGDAVAQLDENCAVARQYIDSIKKR